MGILLISLPLITKNLGVIKYGIWAQILITISLVSPFVLLGLTQSLIRNLASEKDTQKIRESYFSSVFFLIFWGSVISLVIYFSAGYLAIFIFKDPSAAIYIQFSAILVVLTPLAQLSNLYFRIFLMTKLYSFFRFFFTFGTLLLIFLFLNLNFGLIGVIVATILINLITFCLCTKIIVSQIGYSTPNFSELKKLLYYGIPLAPNAMIEWLRTSSDRFLIGLFIGIGAVGIYAASYTIGSLIIVLVLPLQLILFPVLSKMYDQEKIAEIQMYLSYSTKYFLLIAIPAAIGISILGLPILLLLTTPDFITGAVIIPFIAIGGIFYGIYQISINVTQLVKKTQYNLYLYAIAASINISLNFFLIPTFGIIGAAISASVSFIALAILSLHLSFKYLHFKIDIIFVFKSAISAMVMAIVIYEIQPKTLMSILLSIIVGIFLYFTLILLLKGLNEKEIQLLRNLIEINGANSRTK